MPVLIILVGFVVAAFALWATEYAWLAMLIAPILVVGSAFYLLVKNDRTWSEMERSAKRENERTKRAETNDWRPTAHDRREQND